MIRLAKPRSAALAVALCLVVMLLAVPRGFAQFSSGFTGIAVDQTGAVLVGAKVTATNEATHVVNVAVSNDRGNFRIPSLPGGVYTIEVNAPGFKDWKQTGVQLESNETKTLYPSLALPTEATSIQVTDAVAAVEIDKSDTRSGWHLPTPQPT